MKGKGKIITKEWVYACYAQKKRLPWRRFYLDKKDRGEESEEEIWADEGGATAVPTPPAPIPPRQDFRNVVNDEDDYGGSTEVDEPDTDDEIEM